MKKILIVDDQLAVRRLVEMTLETRGLHVLQADSGEAGIAAARVGRPDLIIMDIMMPGGMDGFEAVRELRSHPETQSCPIIILTANDQKPERAKAFACGAEDYLAKPFKLRDLLDKVERVLADASSPGS
ncbi:response regulator [Geoalkalibacter halelectricus]|uniref:Response regulator n=1 Tax=Geoalkalibacter halelectricus TaxID=2847045 RepID=A0ABY5ZQT1_9BACT|nr:response regulator [Geoalkalibacter halelectricus]MDO3377371.1 response regulator [Geoalkalibacter halelectricus]UWZ80864.1 response regulator [Geoalkalibacter halelectricus]